jgi:hypothetical protein
MPRVLADDHVDQRVEQVGLFVGQRLGSVRSASANDDRVSRCKAQRRLAFPETALRPCPSMYRQERGQSPSPSR